MTPQKKPEITATGLKAGGQLLLLQILRQLHGQKYKVKN